jgi:hypothetical protein
MKTILNIMNKLLELSKDLNKIQEFKNFVEEFNENTKT